ncbi:MAG: hypothetical protein WA019_06565 [Candidatus Moraniibacteriota bacterium]
MKNKKIILIVLVLVIIASGGAVIWKKNSNQALLEKKEATQAEGEKVVITRNKAEDIAKDFISKQTFKNDYQSNPISTEVYPEFWNVWFATTDQTKKPNRGLVQINSTTGLAEWKELQ